MLFTYFKMGEPNDFAATRVTWLSFPMTEKNTFLKDNPTPNIKAVNNLNSLPKKWSACMVCVVKALTEDPSATNKSYKLLKS